MMCNAISLQEYNEKVTLLLTTTCVELYRMLLDSLPPRVRAAPSGVGGGAEGGGLGHRADGRPQATTSSTNISETSIGMQY